MQISGKSLTALVNRVRSSALGALERATAVRTDRLDIQARASITAAETEIESALLRLEELVAAFAVDLGPQVRADAATASIRKDVERAVFDPQTYALGLRPTRWRVGVLGAIKRGKSSLINAIAGERIIGDEGSGEGLAFPVHVRYGGEHRAFSLDPSGAWCRIAFDDATAAANASPVLIEVPWKMPRELVLVHAPAFDSGDEYAEEIALAVAAASHATLCLFSRQLSDRELAVFEDVARSEPPKPGIFVHTLADNEAPSERRGVVELAGRYLAERGIAARRIFTVSTLDYRNAHAAGRAASAWNELGALISTIEADAEEHMARLARRAAEERAAASMPAAAQGKPAKSRLGEAFNRIFGRR